jgi:hypothetical protein
MSRSRALGFVDLNPDCGRNRDNRAVCSPEVADKAAMINRFKKSDICAIDIEVDRDILVVRIPWWNLALFVSFCY